MDRQEGTLMPQPPPDPPDSQAESHRWKREPRREPQKGSEPEGSEKEEYKKSLRGHPEHPETGLLEGLMRNELSAAERRSVVRHLLTGCPRCVEVTRRYWSFGSPWASTADDPDPAEGELSGGAPAPRPDAFDGIAAALRRRQRRLTGEHERAPRLLAEMMAHPRARRLALVCGEERFRNLALGELLLERSRLEAQRDPAAASETAELAAAVADRLDPGLWGATLTGLLRARAWAFLGEARRLAGELRAAERALAVAEVLLEHTGPDPQDRAELLCLEASLAQDLRRLDEADRLLDRALDLYRRAGDRQLQGQTLLQKGMLRGAMRRQEAPLQAADLLRAGLALVDEGAQPRLAAEALHRLGGFLLEAGRGDEALRAVERARALYEGLDDRPNLLRLSRLEGEIDEACQRPDGAEAAFGATRDAFLRLGMGREASLSHLRLAVLYARQGRTPEVLRLSRELHPILRAPDIEPDAAAALLAFRRLAETGSAVPELLAEIGRSLAARPAGSPR
jgi:tetratricopeptide (TPR) repeat protein